MEDQEGHLIIIENSVSYIAVQRYIFLMRYKYNI